MPSLRELVLERPESARAHQRAMSIGALLLFVSTVTACPDSPSHAQTRALALLTGGAGAGSVTATPAGPTYANGSTVSIAALPANGAVFTGWTGDCLGTASPCSLVMNDDKSVTAWFKSSTGVGQYDGAYAGSWSGGQSNGANLTGPIPLMTVVNGVLTGDSSPISGSTRALSGTVSATGVMSAAIPSAPAGCSVTFSGQMTTTSSGSAAGSGAYVLIGSSTCLTNTGTWTVVRVH